AGKHLYCEKTMTFTVEETKALKPIVDGSGKVFQVGYQHRYNPIYNMVKEILDGDEFGELSHIECYWNRNGDWRRPVPDPKFERIINWRMYREYSAGLIGELSSHQINIVNWMLGGTPTKVTGIGGIDYWKDGRETYDNVHTIFQYPEGVKLNCTCLTTNAQMGFQMKFYGKNATIQLVREADYTAQLYVEPTYFTDLAKDLEKPQKVDAVSGATAQLLKKGEPISIYSEEAGREDAEPTVRCLASFGDCIRENKAPLVGYESGKGSAICVALANLAMQEEKVIHWKDYV
ncbi:MAG: Gfo/Idh/MocA family oxidoreductase, partial [Lewinella sp.]|nr:Gfo/Idh/MocA family oxidoreductase [Lewinella sp.]